MKSREERIKIIRDHVTFAPDEWVGSDDEFEANENELAGLLADALTEPVTEEDETKKTPPMKANPKPISPLDITKMINNNR